MAINPINIVPDVTQITITTDDKKLVISGDVVANNVNVSQPLVNTIKVQVPGPQGPVGPVGPIGPEPSTGSLMVTGSVSNNTLTFTKGDGSTFDLTPNSGSFSGSFEGTFTRGRIGDGVIIDTGSTIIRSQGFLGQTSASLGLGPAGFVIYSGSSTTTLGADTLQGTGFKFVGPNNSSSISFTDQNQGDVEIKTDKFTLQNSGDITASNALFSGTAIAQNFLQKSVVVHDTVFEGNPSNFSNYFDQATLSSYNLVLDGGRGGEILNNVEFKLDESDVVVDDIILLGDETLTEDKAQVTLRVRSDSARNLFFNLRKPDGSSFDQTLTPGNIYTFEISYDKGGTKTTTALTATDLSIPVTASSTGYNISGDINLGGNLTSTGTLNIGAKKVYHTIGGGTYYIGGGDDGGAYTGDYSTYIGDEAALNLTSSAFYTVNTFVGWGAGKNMSGYFSTGLGAGAGINSKAYSGGLNLNPDTSTGQATAGTFFGANAGRDISALNNSQFIGSAAGFGLKHSFRNTFIGESSGRNNASSFDGRSLWGPDEISIFRSVGIGSFNFGYIPQTTNKTITDSVAIGFEAGIYAAVTQSILIGTYAGFNTGGVTGENIIHIGNNSTINPTTSISSPVAYPTKDISNIVIVGNNIQPTQENTIYFPLEYTLGLNTHTPNTAYTLDVSGSARFTDGIEVTGSTIHNGDLTVKGIVTAEEFHTEFISASIIYRSGSTKFGDTSDDVHQFTGSIQQSGSNSYFLGKVGIGTTSPTLGGSAGIDIYNQSYPQLRLHNASTGTNISSGFLIGLTTTDVQLKNYENSPITISTNDSPRMTILGGGNVGIGTSLPSQKLHVDGNIRVGDTTDVIYSNRFTTLSNSNLLITANTGYDTTFTNGGSERMRITTGGNVGIGTTSPTATLDVSGSGRFTDGLTVTGSLTVSGSNTLTNYGPAYFLNGGLGVNTTTVDSASLQISASSTSFNDRSLLIKDSNGNLIFDVRNSGNVGIGTTAPTGFYKLRVNGPLWADSLVQLKTLAGTSGVGEITYYDNGASLSTEVYGPHPSEAVKGILQLKSQDLNYTAIYNSILHSDPDFLDNPSFVIRSRNTDDESYAMMNYKSGSGFMLKTSEPAGTGTADITFKPSGSEVLFLSSSGNVGIGTTSPQKLLDVNGDVRVKRNIYGADGNYIGFFTDGGSAIPLKGRSLALTTDFSNNAPTNGLYVQGDVGIGHPSNLGKKVTIADSGVTEEGIHIRTGQPTIDLQDWNSGKKAVIKSENGDLTFKSDTSNSQADSLIKFDIDTSEVMRITSTGNVGIGTTSPSYKLDVSGSGNFTNNLTVTGSLYVQNPTVSTRYLKLGWGSIVGNDTNSEVAIFAHGGSLTQAVIFVNGDSKPTNPEGISMRANGGVAIYGGNHLSEFTPSARLHVSGSGIFTDDLDVSGSLHVIGDLTVGKISNQTKLLDVGGNFNFDTVGEPSGPERANFSASIISSPGNIDNGTHYYHVIYKTADGGETGAYGPPFLEAIITDNTVAGQVQLTGIPTSSDARVTARDIYRTQANQSQYYGRKLATLSDNTTTTYLDNLPDSSLDQNTQFYRKANSTAGYFYKDNNLFAQAGNIHYTSFGVDALESVTIGQDNVAFGGSSLQLTTTGKENTAVGYSAGVNNTTGNDNTYLGYVAGYYNTTGNYNTQIGSFAGRLASQTVASSNTHVGYYSGNSLTTNNNNNVGLGFRAGMGFQGSNNINIGYGAGYNDPATTRGDNNITIGFNAGQDTTGDGNILLGREIEAPNAASNGQLSIGNLIFGTDLSYSGNAMSTGNVGIGTSSPTATLDVRGTISQTVDGSTNQYPISLYNDHSGTDYYLLRQRVVNSGNQVRTGIGITGVPSTAFVLGPQTDQTITFNSAGIITNLATINGTNPLKINSTEIRVGDTSGTVSSTFNIVGDNDKVPLGIKQESGTTQNRFVTFLDSGSTEVLGITIDGGFTATDSNLIKRFSFGHGYAPSATDGMGIGLDLKTENASGTVVSVGSIDVVQDDVSADESSMRLSVGETTPTEIMRLQSDGNVGIGTTSPQAKLHVSGTVQFDDILSVTPQDPLPSGVPTGSFAVSSSAPPKPYFYDGTNWNALY